MTESETTDFIPRAIGWPLLTAVGAGSAILIESESLPTGRFDRSFVAALLLVACGAVWLALLATSVVIRLRTARDERTELGWRRWMVAPIIVASTAALLVGEVPLRVRFALSRPALDRLARTVLALPPAEEYEQARLVRRRPSWVGLFPVENVWRTERGMRLTVEGTGFLDRGGSAYFPDRRPAAAAHQYRPLDGPWVLWIQGL